MDSVVFSNRFRILSDRVDEIAEDLFKNLISKTFVLILQARLPCFLSDRIVE